MIKGYIIKIKGQDSYIQLDENVTSLKMWAWGSFPYIFAHQQDAENWIFVEGWENAEVKRANIFITP